MRTVEGYTDASYNEFIGKDGLYWWVGEVESNKDPEHLGRVKVRVAGYYTGATEDFPEKLETDDLPWAVVLQPTSQAGNNGQGESSGQLQPGAIVMGFFLDGEEAQQPIVMGVIRTKKKAKSGEGSSFALSGKTFYEVNAATAPPGVTPGENKKTTNENNSVQLPNMDAGATTTGNGGSSTASGSGTPTSSQQTSMGNPGTNIQQRPGNVGNTKPRIPKKPMPAANGVAGPWKSLENHVNYLLEDLATTIANLTKAENGNFLDIVDNKIVTMEELLGKIRNFLGSVMGQVVASMKEYLTTQVEQWLGYSTTILKSTGVPSVVFALVKSALQFIAGQICGLDQMIVDFISSPYNFIVDNLVTPLIDKVADIGSIITETANSVIDRIICQVADGLAVVQKIADFVRAGMEVVEGVKEVSKLIEKGEGIFDKDFDVTKLSEASIDSIMSILSVFLGFFDFGCNRRAQGGENSAGYFPFLGVTFCDPDTLANLNKKIGDTYGDCGESPVGNLLDSIYNDASPYLTAAKNFVNGASSFQGGTPGRQATVVTTASGSSHTAIKLDNNEYMKHKNREALGDKVSEEEIEAAAKAAGNTQGSGEQVVGDHYQYPKHVSKHVGGDEMCYVAGEAVKTVEGDFRLKVTGDFHLEVGGGIHIIASQAPKQVDKTGKETGESQATKSTINFGSDVDIDSKGEIKMQALGMTVGAKAGTELKLAAPKGSVSVNATGLSLKGNEIELQASNTITEKSAAHHIMANAPVPLSAAVSPGVFLTSGGPIMMSTIPALTNPLPQIQMNATGEIMGNAGAKGILFNTAVGNISLTAVAGAISINATAGAISAIAGAAMTLKAAAVMDLKAASILLN